MSGRSISYRWLSSSLFSHLNIYNFIKGWTPTWLISKKADTLVIFELLFGIIVGKCFLFDFDLGQRSLEYQVTAQTETSW